MLSEVEELDDLRAWPRHFQRLNWEASQRAGSLKIARLPENRQLNRYRDVLPYDHSRIILKNGSVDYINANLVEVPRLNKRYILTQGPLPNTAQHFWQMVWEQKTTAVIMLNRVVEKNQIKCYQYWPLGEAYGHVNKLEFGSFRITYLHETHNEYFTVRSLELENIETEEKRHLTHFHYLTWPDFGVPTSPATFLAFLFEVRKTGALSNDVGPSVIHCSAGIGRSGTLIMVDTLLTEIEQLQDMENIDIKETLLEMRRYRVGLIQTPDQLRFTYLAILEGVQVLMPEIYQKALYYHLQNTGDASDNEHSGEFGDTKEQEDLGQETETPPPLPPRRKLDEVTVEPEIKKSRPDNDYVPEVSSEGSEGSDEILNLSSSSESESEDDVAQESTLAQESTQKSHELEQKDDPLTVKESDYDKEVLESDVLTARETVSANEYKTAGTSNKAEEEIKGGSVSIHSEHGITTREHQAAESPHLSKEQLQSDVVTFDSDRDFEHHQITDISKSTGEFDRVFTRDHQATTTPQHVLEHSRSDVKIVDATSTNSMQEHQTLEESLTAAKVSESNADAASVTSDKDSCQYIEGSKEMVTASKSDTVKVSSAVCKSDGQPTLASEKVKENLESGIIASDVGNVPCADRPHKKHDKTVSSSGSLHLERHVSSSSNNKLDQGGSNAAECNEGSVRDFDEHGTCEAFSITNPSNSFASRQCKDDLSRNPSEISQTEKNLQEFAKGSSKRVMFQEDQLQQDYKKETKPSCSSSITQGTEEGQKEDKESETELRRRKREERKRKTSDLVESIKKKIKQEEGGQTWKSQLKATLLVVAACSLAYLAFRYFTTG